MPKKIIDLYSDTKTKPTADMRRFMAEAEVGDEQYDEDPTVLRLCEMVCELLGKESAVFLPSGTMCNEIAIAVHCRPGDEVICDRDAHIVHYEAGGPAALAGAMIRPVDGKCGVFTGDHVRRAFRTASRYSPRSRLVEVEQTANLGGGTVWPIESIRDVVQASRSLGLVLHMDGARLFNAAVASGIPPREYARPFDSVWIDFTKGLGAPVGAALAGSANFVQEAWRFKQRWGGAMRQAGVIAAAGVYALTHHIERLQEDHENARRLAQGLAEINGIGIEPDRIQTNIVFFDVAGAGWTAGELVSVMKANGVGLGAFSATTIRAVTHLDVKRADVDTALTILTDVLREPRHSAAKAKPT
jgi:threonine aldolase